MITINYSETIIGGQGPYSYEISSNLPCTTITPNTGTTTSTGVFSFSVMYDTQACLDGTILTIQGADSNGCDFDFTIVPSDVCDDLSVDQIAFEAPYTFSVNASHPTCSQGLQFEWEYDSTLFTVSSQSVSAYTSELTLSPRPNVRQFPATSTIAVEVTDCNGCVKREEYVFLFCRPEVSDKNTELYCVQDPDGGNFDLMYRENVSLLPATGCTGIEIDWSTLSISNPEPFNLIFENNNDGTLNIRASLALQDTIQTVFYSVATTDNVRSNQGILRIRIANCQTRGAIFIDSDVVSFECTAVAGETVYFYIEDNVVVSPGSTVDWSSFTILTPPVSTSPSITLENDINGDKRIAYVLPTPIETDTFAFSLCTTSGECSEAAIFTVIECTDGPTAVDDSSCSECGEQITIPVLDNDTPGDSAILPETLIITTAPSVGNASVSAGNIIYTPPAGYNGTVTIQYTVEDQFGNVSNAATLSIEMICAGESSIISICQ